jgi:hypothetical protein
MAISRRTHVVRISDAAPGDPPSDTYIDVEVLDAIAFRDINGNEMVLNMPQSNVQACIKDFTGGGHGQQPNKPTRLSHMKRIVGDEKTQQLDVEIIDILSFRDVNNAEWILDMNSTNGQPSVFNVSDQSGDSKSTRRTHNEKIATDQTQHDPTEFLTVERCDSIAFRNVFGNEMIIKCPSSDDPRSSASRAETFIWSPKNYNPNDPDGPKPPTNTDSNVYVALVKDADGFLTGKAKISQGPFWWIRKVSAGKAYILVSIVAKNTASTTVFPQAPTVEINFGDPKKGPIAKGLAKTERITHQQIPVQTVSTLVYFVWTDIAAFPTADNYGTIVAGGGSSQLEPVPYAGQFSRLISFQTGFNPPENFGLPTITILSTGFFATFADAQAQAGEWGSLGQGAIQEFFTVDGSIDEAAFQGVYAAGLRLPIKVDPFSATILTAQYLIEIPTAEATTEFKINLSGSGINRGTCNIVVEGISDAKKSIKSIADAIAAEKDDGRKTQSSVDTTTFKVKTSVVPGADPKVKAHKVLISVEGGHTIDG